VPRVKSLDPNERRARSKDWGTFGQEFLGGSDRSAAIVGATWLEYRLELLLRSFLVDDEGVVTPLMTGPVDTLGGRSRLAVALGLITRDAFHDLSIIRDIRNAFAPRTTRS